MRIIILLALLLATDAEAMGSKKKKAPDLEQTIRARITTATERMAPDMGIPVELAKRITIRSIKLCPETGRDPNYGSFTADANCSETESSVHAWNMTSWNASTKRGWADYMFATPDVKMGCVDHEDMHKLLRMYGIGGHPKKVTIKRMTDGKEVTLDIPAIVKWRWPSIVIWDAGGSDTNHPWGDGVKCGEGEVFTDGLGI